MFDADPELGSRYRSGLLLAIHKNAKADAYVLFLFDEPRAIKADIDRNLTTLRFVTAAD